MKEEIQFCVYRLSDLLDSFWLIQTSYLYNVDKIYIEVMLLNQKTFKSTQKQNRTLKCNGRDNLFPERAERAGMMAGSAEATSTPADAQWIKVLG